jgi:hypothetical protein
MMVTVPSLIIVNTDAAAMEWIRRYPEIEPKVRVIWNGFDPDENMLAAELPPHTQKTWVHTGALYGGRHGAPILSSIDRLIRSRRLPAEAIRVRFVGACQDAALIPPDVIASGEQQGWLDVTRKSVPRAAATAIASSADVLMLLQPHTDTQVPGKLFEYIRIGRPILALILRGSPIESILEKCGIPNVRVYPDDAPDRIDGELLKLFDIPGGPWKPSAWFEQTFDGREQTRTLCSLMDEVVASRTR